jgi:hypothetical protein
MNDQARTAPRPPAGVDRVSRQVALLDKQVVEIKGELDEHLRDHKQALAAAQDAARTARAVAAAAASRNQVRLTIVLAILGPVATAVLLRVMHLG